MSLDDKLLGILSSCDKEQLALYLNDEESIDILLKSLDQYQLLVNEKEDMQQLNKQLAESNLNRQPVLNELKLKLHAAINEFDDAKKEYKTVREIYDAQNSVNGEMSLEAVYSQLQMSASRAEEETDKSADEFFNTYGATHTEEELNAFQKAFLEARTQAHVKKIKADKMKELLPSYLIQ